MTRAKVAMKGTVEKAALGPKWVCEGAQSSHSSRALEVSIVDEVR